jgi:putative oxygen-independent coproporphyrinogen III oxidase
VTGIYISFPFCSQKCTYCNFASDVFPRDLIGPYIESVREEIRGAELPSEPDTLYLGGGTPSLLEGRELRAIVEALPVSRWREATIEAAPGTITAEKAAAWASLGIQRVSLGVQSFVPQVARAAGRRHTPEQVAAEIALLAREGITNINIDLISGLAHETRETWEISLDWLARLAPPHVSVYMLEVDDQSRLGEELRSGGRRYGAGFVPTEDDIADFYLRAIERLRETSVAQYEISNFARPGCESLHNLKYWNMQPYLGFGADAHSFDGARRWGNVDSPAEYIERTRNGQGVRRETEEVDPTRRLQEKFFTGLRQLAGIQPSPSELVPFRDSIENLTERGWLAWTPEGRLHLTSQGVMFSNEVFEQFIG